MKGKLLIFVTIAALIPSVLRAQLLPRWRDTLTFRSALTLPQDLVFIKEVPDTVSLYFLGDVMSHGAMMRSAGAMYTGTSTNPHERFDFSYFFRHLEGDIAGADIAVCNMEFPLAGPPFLGYPSFSGPDSYPFYLSGTGFDILTLGNNHVLDQGDPGLERTISILDRLERETGTRYTGVSSSSADEEGRYPLLMDVRGVRFAFINFTYGTNGGSYQAWPKVNRMRREDIRKAILRAKDKEADFIIALPHWGIEYAPRHSEDQADLARWMVEEGVDLIVGSHPHVPQDTCVIGKTPVIYSLGNAVSNQNDLPARLELAARVKIVVPQRGEPYMLIPQLDYLWCTKPGMIEDSYTVVKVRDVLGRKDLWKTAGDYEKMEKTYYETQHNTGLYEKNHYPGSH